MYDLRAKSYSTAARSVPLHPLPRWYEDTDETHQDTSVNKVPSSVNQMLYSPDGLLLAVSRSDNVTHVYDSRFLGQILYRFKHKPGMEGSMDDTKYGVCKIDWMVNPWTQHLSLASGGADGTYFAVLADQT